VAEGPDGATLLREAVAARGPVIDLAGAALACAAMDRGGLELAPYRAHLAVLARDVAAAAGARAPAAALAQALAVAHGYAGDRESYDDLDNADLARVIDRRRGLPVALAILWMHAARAQGWRCHGLDAPGHFVIRLEAGDRAQVLDPFDGGRALDDDALAALLRRVAGAEGARAARSLEPVDDRSVLLRLQNNIKLRLVRAGEHARALAVVERMLLIAPRAIELWREAGRLHEATGALRAAIAAFGTAMALAGDGDARQRIAAELAAVQGRLN
jgi:regulator of sirC expression with transglutaminase-like and TPR domain